MNKIQKTNWQVLTALALSLMAVNGVQAADITWGSPTDVSLGDPGVVDISTAGSLLYAYSFCGGLTGAADGSIPAIPPTVNGVQFDNFAVPYNTRDTVTEGDVSLAIGGGDAFFSVNYAARGYSIPFTTVSVPYELLLAGGVSTYEANTVLTLTLGGLTSGENYALQLWSNDSSGKLAGRQGGTLYTDGNNAVTLDNNTLNAESGVGQWVIGNFTANAATQVITIQASSPDEFLAISGFQLRAEPAPEPGTLALLALGVATIAGYGWRRRRIVGGVKFS